MNLVCRTFLLKRKIGRVKSVIPYADNPVSDNYSVSACICSVNDPFLRLHFKAIYKQFLSNHSYHLKFTEVIVYVYGSCATQVQFANWEPVFCYQTQTFSKTLLPIYFINKDVSAKTIKWTTTEKNKANNRFFVVLLFKSVYCARLRRLRWVIQGN